MKIDPVLAALLVILVALVIVAVLAIFAHLPAEAIMLLIGTIPAAIAAVSHSPLAQLTAPALVTETALPAPAPVPVPAAPVAPTPVSAPVVPEPVAPVTEPVKVSA